MATRKRRRRRTTVSAAPRRRRRRRSVRRNPIGALANPRRRRRRAVAGVRRRRRHRRNPPISFRGVTSIIIRGVQDAAIITGGKMGANIIASYIPAFLKTGDVETQVGKALRKVLAAAAVGVIARTVLKARDDTARMAVAGALTAPLEEFIKPYIAGVPVIGAALSAYPMAPRVGAYPARRIGAYPGAGRVNGNAGNRAMASNQAFYAAAGG